MAQVMEHVDQWGQERQRICTIRTDDIARPAVDGLPFLFGGQLEAELEETHASVFGHDFDGLHNTRNDLMFNRGVEVFGDLTDQEDIDVFEATGYSREVLERPN